MTELLRQVFAEIEKLPAEQQDAIATRLLAELKDEQAWEKRFKATTDKQWNKLAQMVRQEIASNTDIEERLNKDELDSEKLDLIEREHPAYEPIVTKVLQDALTEEPSSSAGKGEVRDWLKSLLDK